MFAERQMTKKASDAVFGAFMVLMGIVLVLCLVMAIMGPRWRA
jgi:hypothetical protein